MSRPQDVDRWRIDRSGPRSWLQATGVAIAAMPRLVWRVLFLGVPALVLVAVLVTSRVTSPPIPQLTLAGGAVVLAGVLCGTVLMGRHWRRVVYDFDPGRGRLALEPRPARLASMEASALVAGDEDPQLVADLVAVVGVRWLRVGDLVVGRLDYGGRRPNYPYAVVVPLERYDAVATAFEDHDVASTPPAGVLPGPGVRGCRRGYLAMAWSALLIPWPVVAVLVAVAM